VVLTQEDSGKEFVIAYLSQRLSDTEGRYTFIEKLYLSLYYSCTKLHWYLLRSSCTIVCQYDIIKCMLQKPILSGRLGKWAYALVEYDLEYAPLMAMKRQVVADFIVDHSTGMEEVVCVDATGPWIMFFDGSFCSQGQGVGCFIKSPNGMEHELFIWLEFECTSNQDEYEALLSGLEVLIDLGVMKVEIFGDSKLVVQQINGESQCLDGVLNEYRERRLEMLGALDKFNVEHVAWEANVRANMLAQQASGYDVRQGRFETKRRSDSCNTLVVHGTNSKSADNDATKKDDWRQVLIDHINNPGHTRDRKIKRQALKYTMIDEGLYCRTVEGLLLRCLSEEES
jgi:ribonuclease HI